MRLNMKYSITIKALFVATVFAASAFSQETITADIPVTVNANATVTITPPADLTDAKGATANVSANIAHTLTIVLSGGNVSVLDRTQMRTYAPATVKYSHGNIALGLNSQSFNNATISLYTVNGKLVLRGKAEVSKNTSRNISRDNVAAGVYLLRVLGANGNAYTTRLSHVGGRLNINATFHGDDLSLRKRTDAASDYGVWTITATATGYKDTSYQFSPISGINKTQDITLSRIIGNQFNPNIKYEEFTDPRDGQTYKYVTIGSQTWMAENLNYDGGNGSCYNDIADSCAKYGRLYDWGTAMGIGRFINNSLLGVGSDVIRQGICPSGWHLPNIFEWTTLVQYAGGMETAGTKLRASGYWSPYSGTDQYGFSALPGGFRPSNGYGYEDFNAIGFHGNWWSATELDASRAHYLFMTSSNARMDWPMRHKDNAKSVRCIKNE